MRLSIKYKFSIFIIVILLSQVLAIYFLILNYINDYQMKEQKQNYAAELKKAETFVGNLHTQRAAGGNLTNEQFIKENSYDIVKQLSLICSMNIALYDTKGNIIAMNQSPIPDANVASYVPNIQQMSYLYFFNKSDMMILSNLKIKNSKAAIILMSRSIKSQIDFFNSVEKSLFYISGAIFIVAMLLSLLYFNYFVTKIRQLKLFTQMIGSQDYEIPVIKSKDEIGDLSKGIYKMGEAIRQNIQGITYEKNNLGLAVNKLKQLEDQQKQFIGNITHEFKTPLTSIKAYAELLTIYQDDPALRTEASENIQKETLRLQEMVEKILKLQSVEKYSFEFSLDKVNIQPVLTDIIRRMLGKAEKFGILIHDEIQDAVIMADKDALMQVFINLIDNAIKYNKANGEIWVFTKVMPGKVGIYVRDSGIGISFQDQEKVFEPFFTASKDRSRETGGSGLGLSLVKEMVEKMGARIFIERSNEEGTTFVVEFPTEEKMAF